MAEKEEKVISYRLICYNSNAYCIAYMKAELDCHHCLASHSNTTQNQHSCVSSWSPGWK